MEPKVGPNFWVEMDGHEAEVKLAALWTITNAMTSASNLGSFTYSARRFEFDTGLKVDALDKALAAFPQRYVRAAETPVILIRQFIGDQWGRGERLCRDNRAKALAKPFACLPYDLQEVVLADYPELKPLLRASEGLQRSGSAAAHPSQTRNPKGSGRASQGLHKPNLISSHLISSQEGCGEDAQEIVEGALIPSEAEVLAFAAGYQDLARGLGPIPEAYALNWLAWRTEPRAGAFPQKWQADLRRRFTAHALQDRAQNPAAPPVDPQAALAAELDPEKRAALRRALREKSTRPDVRTDEPE